MSIHVTGLAATEVIANGYTASELEADDSNPIYPDAAFQLALGTDSDIAVISADTIDQLHRVLADAINTVSEMAARAGAGS